MDFSRINNILNEFLQPYDLTAEEDTDFYYYDSKNLIKYSLVVVQRDSELFLSYAKTLGLRYDVDIFLLSFLHELGHSETIDEIDDEVYAYCADVKDSISAKAEITDDDRMIYFDLDVEKVATQWAVDFINENVELLSSLWGKLQPAIMDFYKEINMEV